MDSVLFDGPDSGIFHLSASKLTKIFPFQEQSYRITYLTILYSLSHWTHLPPYSITMEMSNNSRDVKRGVMSRRGRGRRPVTGRKNPAKRGNLRQDRRVYGPVWRNCIIPSANRIVHDNATPDKDIRGLKGFRYAIGDDTIFDGPFSFLRSMHEYRVKKTTFDISIICTPKRTMATHPVEISSVVIPIDTDADDTTVFKSFEHAMEHPGARSTVALSNKVAHHRFTWWPTEPSDQDWRVVKNDNIVYLYVFFRYTDEILKTFSIDTVIRAKVHLNFRGVNFDSTAALKQYSMARIQPRFEQHQNEEQDDD